MPIFAGTNLEATATNNVRVREVDSGGFVLSLSLHGSDAPSVALTAASTYQHGCIANWVESGTGVAALYENTGSVAVPSWNLIGGVAPGDIALAEGNMLIGNAGGVAAALDLGNTNAGIAIGNGTTATINALTGDVAMTNAGVTTVTDLTITSEARGDLLRRGATTWERVAAATSGQILVGNGTDVVSVAVSGDVALAANGAVTIGAGAVTNPKVADSAGVGGLFVPKTAIVVYDFTVDGGTAGVIALTGSPTLPDNAVVWVSAYEVLTTVTTAGADAGTLTLTLPTDGDLFTAIAVSDGSNPWDQGVFVQGLGAIVVASQTPKKLTGARLLTLTAGGQNITAGKIVFHLSYFVSQ